MLDEYFEFVSGHSIINLLFQLLFLFTVNFLYIKKFLQDLLKDKQQHIEQLLKERDLERQEFTKAASQAEDAERQLIVVKKEFENVRKLKSF